MADTIRLRPVTTADARVLFQWVNDPDVRAMSFTSGAVSWLPHIAWLESKLAAAAWLWVAEAADGAPVGQIRFEVEDRQAVLSISVDRGFRRRGYGSLLIDAGCRRLFGETRLERIVAYVKPENAASQRMLAQAGFLLVETATRCGQPAQVWCQTRRDVA